MERWGRRTNRQSSSALPRHQTVDAPHHRVGIVRRITVVARSPERGRVDRAKACERRTRFPTSWRRWLRTCDSYFSHDATRLPLMITRSCWPSLIEPPPWSTLQTAGKPVSCLCRICPSRTCTNSVITSTQLLAWGSVVDSGELRPRGRSRRSSRVRLKRLTCEGARCHSSTTSSHRRDIHLE